MITRWALGQAVPETALGTLGATLSEGDGESRAVRDLAAHDGFVYKRYKSTLTAAASQHLDQLIQMPGVADPVDRELIAAHTSWPVARVTDESGAGVGCVLPKAPDRFRERLGERMAYLEVDLLAQPDSAFARRGLARPSYESRLKVCTTLAAVGELLERRGLVYSDWSYSNAFWSSTQFDAFVIDIDGCQPHLKHNTVQPNWEDPLTPDGTPADTYTDRYRLALLVARCLTGERDAARVIHAVHAYGDVPVARVVLDTLLAANRRQRPTTSTLRSVLIGLPLVTIPVQRGELPPLPVKLPAPQPEKPRPDGPRPGTQPQPGMQPGTQPGTPPQPQKPAKGQAPVPGAIPVSRQWSPAAPPRRPEPVRLTATGKRFLLGSVLGIVALCFLISICSAML